jgi:hypothetical protein
MVLAMQLSYSARSAVLLFLTVAAPKDTCTDGIVARRFPVLLSPLLSLRDARIPED